MVLPLAACSVAGSAQPDRAAMSTVAEADAAPAGTGADQGEKAPRTTDPTADSEPTTGTPATETPATDVDSGGAGDSGATALPDACDLLTHEEANTLAGRPLQDAVPAGLENGANVACQYTSDPNGPGVAQVEVYVGAGSAKALEIDRDVLGHTFTSVPGIADEVLQEDGSIFIRKEATWASINLVLLNDPQENVQRMQDAARIVAGRL